MKKVNLFLLCLLVSSCSLIGNKPKPVSSAEIIGSWQCQNTISDMAFSGSIMFTDNNDVIGDFILNGYVGNINTIILYKVGLDGKWLIEDGYLKFNNYQLKFVGLNALSIEKQKELENFMGEYLDKQIEENKFEGLNSFVINDNFCSKNI